MRRFLSWLSRLFVRLVRRAATSPLGASLGLAGASNLPRALPRRQTMTRGRPRRRFPLWLKIVYGLFIAVLVPVWSLQYGAENFLWFSDIALFGTLIALLFENRFVASMMALAVLIPELLWSVSFFGEMLLGADVIGLAGYMFKQTIPLAIRAMSLFHIVVPLLLLWMLYRLGYEPHALRAQTLLAWIILPLSYVLTEVENNINWTMGIAGYVPQPWMPGWAWVALLMLAFPLLFYLPTHVILRRLFSHAH